jgi:LacI family transcriptional regulator
LQVPLTTVAQQTLEMGRAAATILLNRLGGDESPPQRIVLAPSLVVRESSGA